MEKSLKDLEKWLKKEIAYDNKQEKLAAKKQNWTMADLHQTCKSCYSQCLTEVKELIDIESERS